MAKYANQNMNRKPINCGCTIAVINGYELPIKIRQKFLINLFFNKTFRNFETPIKPISAKRISAPIVDLTGESPGK